MTNWVFIEVVTDAGVSGFGEATFGGAEESLSQMLQNLTPLITGMPVSEMALVARRNLPPMAGLFGSLLVSALEQAWWDILGKFVGEPVRHLLGLVLRDRVPLYANLNRSLSENRTPEAFGLRTREAREAGFDVIKVAPFDGVGEGAGIQAERDLVELGFERIKAVRRELGNGQLLVDCHWRFTPVSSAALATRLLPIDPYWMEAPTPERHGADWNLVRAAAPSLRLAGGELFTNIHDLVAFLEAAPVDVCMPDLRFVGGIMPTVQAATIAHALRRQVSPHNPAGPVATLAVGQACAVMENLVLLEYAWSPHTLRSSLVPSEIVEDGYLVLPDSPGLGVVLDRAVLDAHPPKPVTQAIDTQALY